ncbi:MAG: sodium:proton antiporter [Candidatus Omnitrophica bacterium]|nr:sodium:proton antiporter [Candidatus Omnitrophota bacterium]
MNNIGAIPPAWSTIFFVLQLLAIAILPLTHSRLWEKNKNKAIVSLLLALPVICLFAAYGNLQPVIREIKEYLSFIVLLSSLFIISGGIYLGGDVAATPKNNTIFLLLGGIAANLFGTTGASMLFIRPFLRTNRERKLITHLPVFFIFVVANIGGCLLPLGDPPLFMGYLRGVPFFWTLKLFPEWLFMLSTLLIVFYFIDRYYWNRENPKNRCLEKTEVEPIKIEGKINLLFILGVILSIILIPRALIRELVMILLALLSLLFTQKGVRYKNRFHYAPIIEVAVIFAGIFITMVPALLLLETQGAQLGIRLPWHFFWVTGGLSSFLDNTPTYLVTLSLAQGLYSSAGLTGNIVGIPIVILKAISCGAVFMGANTYIGNGPNFMVKAICDHHRVKTPSFFGYMLWSGLILIPLFILTTLIFF